MKIVIVSAVFPPEPVVSANLSFDLANELSKSDDVIVISPKPTRPFGFKFENNGSSRNYAHKIIGSYVCPQFSFLGRLRETYSFGKRCGEYISKNHRNINHIYSNTWPLFAQYYTVKTARGYNIPITIHIQDVYPESLSNKLLFGKSLINKLFLPLDKFTIFNATNIIVLSEKVKSHLIKTRKIDSIKISVIPNWQDEEKFSFNEISENKQGQNSLFTFMYLGNIGPIAGVELLIDAFAEAKIPNTRLVIAGAGSMKSTLEKYASTFSYVKIEFWPVPNGKVNEIQAYSHIMLLPMKKGNSFNSIPSKLPAYLFSKKPVIACVDENSDTADVIKDSNCGWVILPDDKKNLAITMQKASNLPSEELDKLGLNGYGFALEHFSKAKNLPKLLNIIRKS